MGARPASPRDGRSGRRAHRPACVLCHRGQVGSTASTCAPPRPRRGSAYRVGPRLPGRLPRPRHGDFRSRRTRNVRRRMSRRVILLSINVPAKSETVFPSHAPSARPVPPGGIGPRPPPKPRPGPEGRGAGNRRPTLRSVPAPARTGLRDCTNSPELSWNSGPRAELGSSRREWGRAASGVPERSRKWLHGLRRESPLSAGPTARAEWGVGPAGGPGRRGQR